MDAILVHHRRHYGLQWAYLCCVWSNKSARLLQGANQVVVELADDAIANITAASAFRQAVVGGASWQRGLGECAQISHVSRGQHLAPTQRQQLGRSRRCYATDAESQSNSSPNNCRNSNNKCSPQLDKLQVFVCLFVWWRQRVSLFVCMISVISLP